MIIYCPKCESACRDTDVRCGRCGHALQALQATHRTEQERRAEVPTRDARAMRAAVASDVDRSQGWPGSAKAVLLAGVVGAGLLALRPRRKSSALIELLGGDVAPRKGGEPLGAVEPREIIRRWAVKNGHMPSLGALDAGVAIVERIGQAGRIDVASAAAVVGSLIAHVDDPEWPIARWEEVASQITNLALRLESCTK